MTLRPKQKMFCKEYLIDLNATQAAIRAGYSKKTAAEIGRQNLIKLDIQAEIEKAMAKRAARVELTADTVLKDIMLIKADAMSLGANNKMTDRQAALRACELEGKHLKMFTDRIEHAAGVVVIYPPLINKPEDSGR